MSSLWSFNRARKLSGPAYLRLGKADLGDVHAGPLAEDFDDCLCPVIDRAAENLCLAAGSMVSYGEAGNRKRGPRL